MTRRTLLYLIGEPGVGKTTLMAALTAGLNRTPLPDVKPARELLWHSGRIYGVELGRRRGMFSGTDALPFNAVGEAEQYLRSGVAASETDVLLGEGARLANHRFLGAAQETGWEVTIGYCVNPDVAARRREERGTYHNALWLRGRRTCARRLAENPPPGVQVITIDTAPPAEQVAAGLAELLPWGDTARTAS